MMGGGLRGGILLGIEWTNVLVMDSMTMDFKFEVILKLG